MPSRDRTRPAQEPGDEALFEEAMADVQRIESDRHAPEITYRAPVSLSEREREALRELDALVAGAAPVEMPDPDEHLEGRVAGLDPRVMKQLRRGEFTVQADLDLHGIGAEAARALVERFLLDAHGRGLRCVRIIHGRGRNSPDGIPVLKSNLPRWLARGPARTRVLAYASAAPSDGGTGATYVLLRRGGRRPRRQPL